MALWLVRAGKYGEHEERFFEDSRVYGTWAEMADVDLSKTKDIEAILEHLRKAYPDAPENRLGTWARQKRAFIASIKPGDWVVAAWQKAHRWHPHQLRHNAATELRKEFGIEAARIILGHRSAAITEVYAEKDEQQAVEAMAQVG